MWITANDLDSIEPRIGQLVRELADAPSTGAISPALAPVLEQVVDQAVESSRGGKRLRALLAVAAFDVFRNDLAPLPDTDSRRDAMIDLACAIEVFQTAALVHDDIIDESDLRRGRPSAHRALEQVMGNASMGRGLGLMLGDVLATACIEITRQASRGMSNEEAVNETFLTMQREVEIGQILDLAIERTPLDDPTALAQASLNVFRWKTASYTTIAPLHLAMLAAGVLPDKADEASLAIGQPLGLAFQLADDLLDVIGSSHNTGKPVGGDIREGKRTVLLADALTAAGTSERAELISMFEAPSRNEDQVRRAIALFRVTGAVDRSRERITSLWEQSQAAIRSLHLDPANEERLTTACARFIPETLR